MKRTILALALLLALPACNNRAPSGTEIADEPAENAKGAERGQAGKPAPDKSFHDPAGKPISLAAFKGRPVLVNLWASWCAPCVKELPTLDRLAREAGPGGLQVVAISQDSAPPASVVAFLKTHGIATLAPYHDPKMAMSGALAAEILPTSILFDAEGKEVWRYVGDLDWSGAEAAKLLAEAAGPKPG